jgi:hypothetical protein
MSKRTIAAYLIAATAGLGLIWVPDEIFYEPEVFFMAYLDNFPSS